jgi:protein ImuB
MWWAALLPAEDRSTSVTLPEPTWALALWALQFTPRVALVDEGVLMEVEASLRLFGGAHRLAARLRAEAPLQGVGCIAWAPTGLAALALARAGEPEWSVARLAALPVHCLSAARPHAVALAHIGCRTLGELSRLPRAGVARRFGQDLLDALDQLHGRAPERHAWVRPPERFDVSLELWQRVDAAPALLFGARRLLGQLVGWLAARHGGITAFTLHWTHDAMRARGVAEGGRLTVRTAAPTRDAGHLSRLLAEHLAHVRLAAPVGHLRLVAEDVVSLPGQTASWLAGEAEEGEALAQALERVAARLGADRVRHPVLHEDHRPECMTAWRRGAPADVPPRRAGDRWPWPVLVPQPAFLRPRPLRLGVRGERPCYQGEALQLLLGPQRLEAGWWDGDGAGPALRDYWVAASERAGLLWVYQTRLAAEPAWFLHGYFA